MILRLNEFRVIHLNKDSWTNSKCSCKEGMKLYKCSHVISLASRLGLASFETIARQLPLTHKRKRGQPCKTVSALMRQPNELQIDEPGVLVETSQLASPVKSASILKKIPKKRGRKPKQQIQEVEVDKQDNYQEEQAQEPRRSKRRKC